jgi:hypothetical protein
MPIGTVYVNPKTPLEEVHMGARSEISYAGLHNFGLNTEYDSREGLVPSIVEYKGVDNTTGKVIFQGSCLVNQGGHIVSKKYAKEGVNMFA